MEEVKCRSLIDLEKILRFEATPFISIEPFQNGFDLFLDRKLGFDGLEKVSVERRNNKNYLSYVINYYAILPLAIETINMMEYDPNEKLKERLKQLKENVDDFSNNIIRNIQLDKGDVIFYSYSMESDSISEVQEMMTYFIKIFKEKSSSK